MVMGAVLAVISLSVRLRLLYMSILPPMFDSPSTSLSVRKLEQRSGNVPLDCLRMVRPVVALQAKQEAVGHGTCKDRNLLLPRESIAREIRPLIQHNKLREHVKVNLDRDVWAQVHCVILEQPLCIFKTTKETGRHSTIVFEYETVIVLPRIVKVPPHISAWNHDHFQHHSFGASAMTRQSMANDENGLQVVENDEILRSEQDERIYRHITLPNKMQASL